ncbi:MAG: septum formation protein Maf [Candidatus Omnitrophica bacterium]|nr:septum formation protein Maf [Candidatus Omnitrophota bacterium]
MQSPIILASASKRRSRILTECGIPHTIVVSNVDEDMTHEKAPQKNALYNAVKKAETVSENYTSGFILGADTVVSFNNRITGKPSSMDEAQKMAQAFSGKKLTVYTGLCVIDVKTKKKETAVVSTDVRVKKISQKMCDRLLADIDPLDRAGGFSIEGIGSYVFDSVGGSFYNVLGLPMITVYELFQKLGIDLLDYSTS